MGILYYGWLIPWKIYTQPQPIVIACPDGKELGDGHPQTSGQEHVQSQGQGTTDETCCGK